MTNDAVIASNAVQTPRFAPLVQKPPLPYGLPIVDSCVKCTLRKQSSFCMVSESATREFDRRKHVSFYPRGAVIFLEGQDARGVYVVCQGGAKLTTANADGKRIIVRIAEPGTVFGLHACITGKVYETTAETTQPAQLAFISRDDFVRFVNNHPDACWQAAGHLAGDCQSAYRVIRSLGLSHSIREKLAQLLLECSADGTIANGTIRVKLPWSHQELAELIGTSRETVTRTLSSFKKEGVLELSGATLFIKNTRALQDLIRS